MADPGAGTYLLRNLTGGFGFKIVGQNGGDQAGFSVAAAGDQNSDGIADLIVGARNADGSNGAAYVVYGSRSARTGPVDLDSVATGTGGFKIRGEAGAGLAGYAVASAGDVDGDGREDLIVGAPNDDRGGTDAGSAYLVYGVAGGRTSPLDLSGIAGGTGGFKLFGQNAGDGAGFSVSSAGDFNGDGFADLLIGAPFLDGHPRVDQDTGAAYVVYGGPTRSTGPIDLDAVAAGTGGFRIAGLVSFGGNQITSPSENAGRSVAAAGDVNGDGLDDIIIGSPDFKAGPEPPYYFFPYGRAHVVFGRREQPAEEIRLGSVSGGFEIRGRNQYGNDGAQVAGAGDVNGDGIGDLIVGSRNDNVTYVVYGRTGSGGPVDLAQSFGGFTIIAEAGGDGLGLSVSKAGDVNGDGIADLLVGARHNEGSGAAYVVFGASGGPAGADGTVELAAVAAGTGGFKIQGVNGNDLTGHAVTAAGDINGDGLHDILIGAPQNDEGGGDAGAAYVVFGARSGFPPPPPGPTAGNDVLEGSAGANTIDLLAGNDRYDGLNGNDTIRGNAGADWLRGGIGDDTFLLGGSAGPDLGAPDRSTVRNPDMIGSNGAADAVLVAGRHVVLDVLDGSDGNDLVIGSAFSDVVVLSAPGSAVYAGQNANLRFASIERFELGDGNDVLSLTTTIVDNRYRDFVTALGGRGNDVLWGGAGSDRLFGEDGNDNLVGGLNTDFLTGGAGRDMFGFARNFSRDFVLDFTQGQDILRIKGFGPNFDSFAEISGAVSTVSDFDGDGQFDDTQINLVAGGTEIVLRDFTGTLVAGDFQFVT